MQLLGVALLALLAVPSSCQFTQERLLNGDARPGDGSGGKKTYEHYMELLRRGAEVNSTSADYFEDGSGSGFKGTFLAFDDSAVDAFARAHNFADGSEFMGSSYAMGENAAQIVNLHKLSGLGVNASDDDYQVFVTADDGESRLRLVLQYNSDMDAVLVDQAFSPTLQEGDGKFLDEGGSSTDKQEINSKRTRRCVYVNKMMAPVSLLNALGSRFDNIYEAIANTGELSQFRELLDANPDIKEQLESPDYDGTLLAPHNDAFRLLRAEVGGNSSVDFTSDSSEFKHLGTEVLRYHILPYNFTVANLTEPGNGRYEGEGRERVSGLKKGDSNGRRLLQERAENRFQTGRRNSDLKVIDPGNGDRAFVRGAAGESTLMSKDSDMSVGNAYVHMVDRVVLPMRILASKKIDDFFSKKNAPPGVDMDDYTRIKKLLKKSDAFADSSGNAKFLENTTFIALTNDALLNLDRNRISDFFKDFSFDKLKNLGGDEEELVRQHIILWGPNDGEFEEGEVYQTEAGTHVRYRYNEDRGELGQGSFTLTSAQVTRSPSSRRLLEESGIAGIIAVGGDSQVAFSSGGTIYEDGASHNLPAVGLMLIAALALFILSA